MHTLRAPPRWDLVNVLKNKKILITAGPTWVPIDKIRVISNVSSGRTGILLAKEAARQGGSVTLLLGPVGDVNIGRRIDLIRFRFFDDLKKALQRQLSGNRFDAIIHLAAVSDFRPVKTGRSKISSGRALRLKLVPTEKLSGIIRKRARMSFLVIFKLEAGTSRHELIKRAKKAMQACSADMVVANMFKGLRYIAYVIVGRHIYSVSRKENLPRVLLRAIEERIG